MRCETCGSTKHEHCIIEIAPPPPRRENITIGELADEVKKMALVMFFNDPRIQSLLEYAGKLVAEQKQRE